MARKQKKQISPRRIGLFGLFGTGNAGNDGSLEAMLIFLRQARPNAELACICGGPDEVARRFQVASIPLGFQRPANVMLRFLDRLSLNGPRVLASWVLAVRHARNLDVLIIPGTGILDDFGQGPTGTASALFGWCLGAKLCGAKIAFVSIGAGPIHNPVSRWLMKSAAAMAEYRSYRDTVSTAFMEHIGFNTRNDPVYPDLAFKLPAPRSTSRHTKDGPLTVGVGVMNYHGWRKDRSRGAAIYAAYIEKITNFVLWLLDQGYRVRVLVGDEADSRAVADVVTKVEAVKPDVSHGRLLADPMRSLHDLMQQIAETDVVVATRFHNVVCGLKLGKPMVSIGYAEKNDALMQEMGVGRFCQHIERLDLDLLIEQFTQLITDLQRYEQSIRDTNLAYQERLNHQESLLASRLL